jgi:hypothetical protein
MRERVAASIADRRIEVGAKMFNPDMDDETLERIKVAAAENQADAEEVTDDSDEDINIDDENESDEDPDISDEDLLKLSDEEWAELGIDEWDFEEDSDQKEEE